MAVITTIFPESLKIEIDGESGLAMVSHGFEIATRGMAVVTASVITNRREQ